MKKRNWKKIVLTSLSVFVGLVIILAIHIYWVTKPRVDAHTRILARIDLHQPITQTDANQISTWLYRQKGVEHVVVSPGSQMALFSYAPIQNNGNQIAQEFAAATSYKKAVRYLPAVDPNATGCPVATTSFTYKVYSFIAHVL